MNPQADFYFDQADRWQPALAQLRRLVLSCGLTEEVKWGVPCYTFQESNIALLHTFKNYCALLFFKGALLHDADGLLVQQTKNTQATRQMRFTTVQQIAELETAVKAYLYEALEVERLGVPVRFKETAEFSVAEEFQRKLDEIPTMKTAFYALTPGRQRAYLLYFSAPKQAKTRAYRVEKHLSQILDGKGLND